MKIYKSHGKWVADFGDHGSASKFLPLAIWRGYFAIRSIKRSIDPEVLKQLEEQKSKENPNA